MRYLMTEAERMKSLSKSFEVFEFKEDDELPDMAVKKFSHMFGYHHAVDVSGTEIRSSNNCGANDNADIDDDAAGSFTPTETEDFAKETPELAHVMHNNFGRHEQAAGTKSNTIESDKSVDMASDADESMSERSPSAIANNKASSDGLTDICFSGWDYGDERMGIVFYPDYIDYCGTYYPDSVVSFSRSSIEARSKTICESGGSFHIHLEIEDIVRIESQWCARFEAGTINIYFISKDAVQDDIVHNASEVQELKFPAVDSNWYKKQEAIESLDVRYKALWNVLLDTGMEKCSVSPEEETTRLKRSYFPKFDKPFEEVIYPKGDPDAVSISKRDVDLLLPDTFVNDTIIDFYIKYLKTGQHDEERTKFHFFNSFFFRKLADMDKDPSSAFDGKAAFQRVRKWTRKVNLLEKDFIFIPVNYNYHWSLIVICYFGEVANYQDVEDDKSLRVPCILHMDSLRGNHVGLKDLIQSYLWEEWKERQKGTCEDLYSKFRNLKFVPLELPQQQNSYDCGLFLLHYVELFLEDVPTNFSIYKVTSSSKFLQADWFPPGEASMKRSHIERLINDLLETHSEDRSPSGESGMHCSPEAPTDTRDYENSVDFLVKSDPLSDCHENSLCREEHGIEMTLLPASSIMSSECTTTSGLILKELFQQPSASESFNDAHWGALESRSLNEFTRPDPPTEEEVEASECFVSTELQEPVFQNLDSVTQEAPVYPYPSQDFRSELLHQPPSEHIESHPVTSGCHSGGMLEIAADVKWQSVEGVNLDGELHKHGTTSLENVDHFAFSSGQLLNAEESHTLAGISDQNGDPCFLKEASELHNLAPSHESMAIPPAFASSVDKSDDPVCESSPSLMANNDQASDSSPVSSDEGSDGEQRTAKRMRIIPPNGGEIVGNLCEDM